VLYSTLLTHLVFSYETQKHKVRSSNRGMTIFYALKNNKTVKEKNIK
jgi:hypothetical protein